MFEILFWVFAGSVLHTYLFYPILLKMLAIGKKQNEIVYEKDDDLPGVSVIMAAYNEEEVIHDKIESIFTSGFPSNKIELLVGTDNCSDRTDQIIEELSGKYDGIRLIKYSTRQGKANIINNLQKMASYEILILTDANVMFTEDTIYQLMKHFKNPGIAVVGGNIVNTNLKKSGISIHETKYLSRENIIKYQEGIIWGSMIGAFGGIYAIRSSMYQPVPKNYFMDDFYITLHAISQGGKSVNELNAICYEDVSNLIQEEFRRKIRISIGNFQNLSTFYPLLFGPNFGTAFSFFSHKVLRWFTPFFLIFCLILNMLILIEHPLYVYLLYIQLFFYLIPLIEYLLRKIKIHILLLRFITHFVSMNLALFIGFFKFIKGVNSNVWQPTRRFQ